MNTNILLQLTKTIGDVTKSLDKAMASMDLEKVSAASHMIWGVFGKLKDFYCNLNSVKNLQTRKMPLKYLIHLQPAVKIARRSVCKLVYKTEARVK